jgi:hypothetical protein
MKSFRTYLLVLLLLAACAGQVAPPPALPPAAPVDTAESWYRQAAKAGKKVYAIDGARSLITITVRRGGALARMGHDHVVASRTLTGFVAPDAGRADFHFRLDQMSVDEPALRTAAGLDTQPSADAIAGTRANMLTRVLEAERYPMVMLRVDRAQQADMVRLTVTLHGVTHSMDVPLKIEHGAGSLTASGSLTLMQTAFGITPMSVMGGAMTVQDPMELQFKIVASAPR